MSNLEIYAALQTGGDAGDLIFGVAYLLVFFGVYMAPTLVAVLRGHHNRLAIGALNFLLGWTVLGWIGALVWALTAVESQASATEG